MPTFYSEVGTARIREVVADVSTLIWVVFWIDRRAEDPGRDRRLCQAWVASLRDGGTSIQGAGTQIGDVLGNVPLIGGGVDALTTGAFSTAGAPFVEVGEQLESLLLLIARLLAILVVAVFVLPWLFKYLPWRTARVGTLRAAHQVIRRGGVDAASPAMQQAAGDPGHQPAPLRRPARAHDGSDRRLRGRPLRAPGQGRAGERRAALRRLVP